MNKERNKETNIKTHKERNKETNLERKKETNLERKKERKARNTSNLKVYDHAEKKDGKNKKIKQCPVCGTDMEGNYCPTCDDLEDSV